ncbi:unnamed protein product [Ixodes hexagonus]
MKREEDESSYSSHQTSGIIDSNFPESPEAWEAPDGAFKKTVVQSSNTFSKPLLEASCSIKVLSDEDNVVGLDDAASKVIVIGDVRSDVEFILERCLLTMNVGEICDIQFKLPLKTTEPYVPRAAYLFDSSESQEDRTQAEKETADGVSPPNDNPNKKSSDQHGKTYKVQIQLESFVAKPAIFEMKPSDKWYYACQHKDNGVSLFSAKEYKWAFRHFSLAFKYIVSLEHDNPTEDVVEEFGIHSGDFKLKCLLNLAACQLQNGTYHHVVTNCARALEMDPDNVKALFRRGTAFNQLQEYEKAKDDLERAAVLDPKNVAVQKQIVILRDRTTKLNKYFATAMKKLFK